MHDSDEKTAGDVSNPEVLDESQPLGSEDAAPGGRCDGQRSSARADTDDVLGLADLKAQVLADDLENLAQEARLRQRMFPDLVDDEDGAEAREAIRLGDWILLDRLGRGGGGSVYAAYNKKLDRRDAIKFLRPEPYGDRDGARARMLREAQALASIDHLNVIPIYHVGERDGGELYLVMKLVEGQTLHDWQRERSLNEILDVYLQAARGLTCIHGEGLVHRDFKPENTLVDGQGRAVVIDLGLVHAINEGRVRAERPAGEADSALDQSITRPGARLGTRAYMAPEQLAGQPTSARSDQFAFCVALYEAVCGVHPYSSEHLSYAERLHLIERGALQPPAKGTRVPAWLERVLRRGLSTRQEDRFPDMEALVRAIEHGRRKRWPWFVLALGGAAVVVAMAMMLSAMRPPSCHESAVNESQAIWNDVIKEKMRGRMLAVGLREDAWNGLAKALDQRIERWRVGRVLECKERREAHDDDHWELANVRASCLARSKEWLSTLMDDLMRIGTSSAGSDSRLVEAAKNVTEALVRRRDCSTTVNVRLAYEPLRDPAKKKQAALTQDWLRKAERSDLMGNYDQARQEAENALALVEPLEYPPLAAEVLYRLGHVLGNQDELVKSEGTLARAVENAALGRSAGVEADAWLYLLKLAADGFNDPLRAREWLSDTRLGLLRSRDVRHDILHAAESDEWEHILDSDALEGSWLRLSEYLEGRGMLARLEGRYDEAIDWHRRVLAVRRKARIPVAWGVSKSLNNLANALALSGNEKSAEARDAKARLREAEAEKLHAEVEKLYGEAEERYTEALTLRTALYGERHPMVAQVHFNLGRLAETRGEFERGREELERALSIHREHRWNASPLLLTLLALAHLELSAGNLGDAEAHTREIADIHRRLHEDEGMSLERAQEHLMVAAMHQVRERLPEALAEVEVAIGIFEHHQVHKKRSQQSHDYAWALHDAGQLNGLMKRWEQARRRLETALIMYECCSAEDEELLRSIQVELAKILRALGVELERARELERAASARRED